MTFESSRYRPCVGIVLFNADRKVFVGKRIDSVTPQAWQMPQGGIDDGESVAQAAFRELQEETGCNRAEILEVAKEKLRYDVPPEIAKNLWQGRYDGQDQTWVAAKFLGEDSDINLNWHTPPEFCAWQWVALDQTIDLVVPFKRDVYRQVIAMFSHLVTKA